jgi:hypothetical protein
MQYEIAFALILESMIDGNNMVFQIISSSPIPRKLPLASGMATKTDQFSSVGILPVSKIY